ncbi:zinc-dependent metalloprotease [Winogradskyella algicola]|uniref:zinc-dependent metalloprotease n=1 Tax=Winogradskyella algicola TaxID=2575815 RepID=UPI0014868395|nr:zinc-dependent metalloprotease [Winogradskyella algicola]
MKNFTFGAVIAFFSLFTYSVLAQQCAFDKQREALLQNPEYVQQEQLAEQKIQNFISDSELAQRNGTVFTIPVVVHVLHLGEAEGTGSNISDAQIQSSIDNLNDFYRGLTPASAVDFEIEFALAQRDPNCATTNGINRIDASGLAGYSQYGVNVLNSNGADYSDIASLISWPQTDYLNIWIVTELDGNNGGFGFQGYAYFYNEIFSTHGSVMMSTVFGYDPGNTNGWGLNSNGDNSTVVHEIGHYFQLYHTFQGDDTNNDGVADTCPADATVGLDSDGCADTVPHQRETSTCPANNACTGNPWVDNNTINNVMSYYFCTDRLTEDQKIRARAAMTGTRIVDSKGDEAPESGFMAPTAVCTPNSPAGTNLAGILSVELNSTTFISSTTDNDGGNLDRSVNCSGLFNIDTDNPYTMNVEIAAGNFHQLGVWIDWNNDGDFDDDAETQHYSEDIAGSSIVPVSLTYPTTIPYDSYVRVRLITDVDNRYGGVNTINSPCYTSLAYGQSEDYVLYIEPGTLSVEDIETNELIIYSDNSNDELIVKGQLLEVSTANLYDIHGRLVKSEVMNTTSTKNTIDVGGLSSGIYIVKVSNNSQLKVKKVVLD